MQNSVVGFFGIKLGNENNILNKVVGGQGHQCDTVLDVERQFIYFATPFHCMLYC